MTQVAYVGSLWHIEPRIMLEQTPGQINNISTCLKLESDDSFVVHTKQLAQISDVLFHA